jgi:hypothetical protein
MGGTPDKNREGPFESVNKEALDNIVVVAKLEESLEDITLGPLLHMRKSRL